MLTGMSEWSKAPMGASSKKLKLLSDSPRVIDHLRIRKKQTKHNKTATQISMLGIKTLEGELQNLRMILK